MDEMKRLAAFLYGFAPQSALTCSIEGDPAPEGGTPPPSSPPPAPATPASQPQFTPEQLAYLEAEKQRAHNAGAAAARRAEQGRQPKPGGEPPPAPTPAPTPNTEGLSDSARERMFGRALGKFDLNDKAIALVEREFANAKPSDPAAWLDERAEAYGWKRLGGQPTPAANGGAPNGAQPTAPPAGGTVPPPVLSRGTPPPPSQPTEDTPILSMSIPDREALRAKIGDIAFADRHLKELAARNVRVRPRLV